MTALPTPMPASTPALRPLWVLAALVGVGADVSWMVLLATPVQVQIAFPEVEVCLTSEVRVLVERVLLVVGSVVVAAADEGDEEVDDIRVEDGGAEDSVVVVAAAFLGVVVTIRERVVSTESCRVGSLRDDRALAVGWRTYQSQSWPRGMLMCSIWFRCSRVVRWKHNIHCQKLRSRHHSLLLQLLSSLTERAR